MLPIPWLAAESLRFPSPALALEEPNGLLAVGGDLRTERLLAAYRQGIFPWYEAGQPILWWSPDPRTLLFPENLHISRSLRKVLRRGEFRVSLDRAFDAVIGACAGPRDYADGTWLTPEMQQAYGALHREGWAHSVEVWQGEALVGGLYGIAMGTAFFGESMFSWVSNASKVGFVHLVGQLEAWGYRFIDCQVYSDHLFSLGAQEIPRREFLQRLAQAVQEPAPMGEPSATGEPAPWTLSWRYVSP